MNKTFITGVDRNYEWLLKWWVRNLRKHNKDVHLTICDFGISKDILNWAKSNAEVVKSYNPHPKCAWYYKTQSLLDSKYEFSCWIDSDCEILKPIEDIFDYAKKDFIGLTEDIGKRITEKDYWWATGVILIKNSSNILQDWDKQLKKLTDRGDQEALHFLLNQNPQYKSLITSLPIEYQWLRLQLELMQQDSPDKKIVHWTGSRGKSHIRNNLMISSDYFK